MNRNEESLIEQGWRIHGMNGNEWFIECTGMKDLMNEQQWMVHWINDSLNEQKWRIIDWTEMKDSWNEREWMIHKMYRNEEFDAWTAMNGSLD